MLHFIVRLSLQKQPTKVIIYIEQHLDSTNILGPRGL